MLRRPFPSPRLCSFPSALGVALLGVSAVVLACSAGEEPDGAPEFNAGPASWGGTGGASSVTPGTQPPGTPTGSAGTEGAPPVTGLQPSGNAGTSGVNGSGSAGAAGAPTGSGGAPTSTAGAGGAPGTAGAPSATGGTAGVGVAGAAGAGAVEPLDCGDPSVLFCEDFEADAAGAFPGASQWLPEAGGCGSHTTSSAVPAHAGAQSLQATGAGYPGCMVHADVSGQNELYIRSWVRFGAPSTDSGHHVALLELGPRSNQDDPEFRIGMRADAPCNDPGVDVTVGGLSAGERTECSGFDLSADRWSCVQAHVSKQNGSITFDVRVDGAAVVPETTYTGLNAEWNDALFFKFGRASYGGNNTWSVWHDDIAVGTAPIACD